MAPVHGHAKGRSALGTFIGFLTIFAMWASLRDNVWRVSVEPTKVSIYRSLSLPIAFVVVVVDGGV